MTAWRPSAVPSAACFVAPSSLLDGDIEWLRLENPIGCPRPSLCRPARKSTAHCGQKKMAPVGRGGNAACPFARYLGPLLCVRGNDIRIVGARVEHRQPPVKAGL